MGIIKIEYERYFLILLDSYKRLFTEMMDEWFYSMIDNNQIEKKKVKIFPLKWWNKNKNKEDKKNKENGKHMYWMLGQLNENVFNFLACNNHHCNILVYNINSNHYHLFNLAISCLRLLLSSIRWRRIEWMNERRNGLRFHQSLNQSIVLYYYCARGPCWLR